MIGSNDPQPLTFNAKDSPIHIRGGWWQRSKSPAPFQKQVRNPQKEIWGLITQTIGMPIQNLISDSQIKRKESY